MTTPKKEMKDVPCKKDQGGCGEVLCQTDGEFLFVKGLILNRDDASQLIGCVCGKDTVWKCHPQYLHKKKRRRND